ncbi:MAG: hypothetical protein ABGZ35_20185 [Planctomycetaceae bacterium]
MSTVRYGFSISTGVSYLICTAYCGVAFSSILWWWQRPSRFLFTYFLFPLRILFALLSFGWLATLILLIYPSTGMLHHVVWGTAIGLEVLRFSATLYLHLSRGPSFAPSHRNCSANDSERNADPYAVPFQ